MGSFSSHSSKLSNQVTDIQLLTSVIFHISQTNSYLERYRASSVGEYKYNDMEFQSDYENSLDIHNSMTFSPKS